MQRSARPAAHRRKGWLKCTLRKVDGIWVTLRRTGSWLAYGLLSALLGLVAVGVPFPTQAGGAITPVGQVVETVELVEPEPVEVVAEQAPEPPTPAPEPAAPEAPAPAPAPEPPPDPDPCSAALDGVAAAGLPLPAGVDYRCPSTRFAHQGAACWDAWPCPATAFIAINMSLLQHASPEYMRHVVAHEICHIIDFRDQGWSTEPRADACAAEYGF